MAKKSSVERNEKRRKLAQKYAAKRAALKAVIYDDNSSVVDRMKASWKLTGLPKNSAKGRVRNRCKLTGRPRAYYRKFELCRVALRDLVTAGLVPGMKKGSWG